MVGQTSSQEDKFWFSSFFFSPVTMDGREWNPQTLSPMGKPFILFVWFSSQHIKTLLWCSPWDIDVWDPGILEKDYFGCEAELWQILQFDGGDGDDGGGDDDDDDGDGDGDKRSGYNLVEPWHILQY